MRKLLLACLLLTPNTDATVVRDLTLDQAVAAATEVVIGAVVACAGAVDNRGVLYTDCGVQVMAALRGRAAPGETLVVRSPGGIVGELGSHVAGSPRYTPAEEVLLFLEPDATGTWRTVGLFQGAYTIVRTAREPEARQKSGEGALRLPAPPDSHALPAVARLLDLELRIRAATGPER